MATKWINCADEMPDGRLVLVAWRDGAGGYDVARWVGGWVDSQGLDFDYGRQDHLITKWAYFDLIDSPPLPTKETT